MSIRSRREHKPTTKYLDYCSEVCITANTGNRKLSRSPEQENRCNTLSPVNSNPISSLIKRPVKICGRRKLATDKVEVLCEDNSISSPESAKKKPSHGEETSPEIRRSGRKQKPNLKLQEYIHPSICNISSLSVSTSLTPNKGNGKINGGGNSASFDSSSSKSPVKNVEKDNKSKRETSVEPYFNGFDIHEDEPSKRKLSIGLVDCFEGLTKELAKTYPVTSVESDTQIDTQSDESLKQSDDEPEKPKDELPLTRRGTKRSLNDTYNRDFSKQKRFKPSTVRNLTKTRKSTRVTTIFETVDLTSNKRRRILTKNKKLKLTKHYPVKESMSKLTKHYPVKESMSKLTTKHYPVKESMSKLAKHYPVKESTHTTTPVTIKEEENIASATPSDPKIGIKNSLKKSSLTQKYFKKPEVDTQAKDIKETLRKFLIMGTKVANAISETLKHNEEALLSKSSAFEKKCLSLVHALAQQGSDLKEEDMEKVLKLLDEEQEERRAYRHTFLESLRVSHLTNMALYSQMLRLLKTL